MGPRVKKPRSSKAKDLQSSANADNENVEGGDDKINEVTDSQEELPKTEVDNGGEEAPPLKKSRGRQNAKKGSGKSLALPPVDEDNAGEGENKSPEETSGEENINKVSSDPDEEEAAPARKGRSRGKKVTKDETVGKVVANDDDEVKEVVDAADPGVRKGRQRKKKVDDDEPEVMPKKKDRGRKAEAVAAEDAPADEGSAAASAEESRQHKTSKREKKQPAKKAAAKSQKDQDEGDGEVEGAENGVEVEEQAEAEVEGDVEEGGGGDVKQAKKGPRGKAANKATDNAASKKPAGRGKKAVKGDDVPVDGKKLRVLVEHCKS